MFQCTATNYTEEEEGKKILHRPRGPLGGSSSPLVTDPARIEPNMLALAYMTSWPDGWLCYSLCP